MGSQDRLLDTLYAAPTTPSLWEDVLASCVAMVGADSGWVCELDRRDRSVGSGFVRDLDATTQDHYFAHFAALDPFRSEAAAVLDPSLGLWSDERYIAKRDLVRSEFYADFMRPIRVHSILIIRMFDDGDVTRSMHLNYRRGGQAVSQGLLELQATFAHLKRAAALSREVGRLSCRGAALGSALDKTSGCVLLLVRRGRVYFATDAAEAMLRRGDCLVLHEGKVRAARSADATQLQKLLMLAMGGASRHRSGGSIHLAVEGRRLPMVVTIAPLGPAAIGRDDPVAMVTVRDPDTSITVPHHALARRFGLTPAEWRIALMLAAGSSPREIAEMLAISYNTVRNHLKKIYDKFDVRRQSELVAGLLRLGLVEMDSPREPHSGRTTWR